MSLEVLTTGGGGESASIFITGLSSGDTVSASNGSKIKNAKWNSTASRFEITKIKEYGTWTVTATDGTKTKTQNVLVDAAVEYEIEMDYKLWLYREGDECEEVTGGWIGVNTQHALNWAMGTATKNANNLYLTATGNGISAGWTIQNAIKVTNYTKLKAVVTGVNNYNRINLYTGTAYPDTSVAYKDNSFGTDIEVVVDVSTITGEYKVHLGTWGGTLTIRKVWLEYGG